MREVKGLSRVIAAAVALAFVAVQPAWAGLIQYDGFEAYAADTALTGKNNGTWGGAWTAVSGIYVRAGTLSYNNGAIQVSGGNRLAQVEDAATANDAINRPLVATYTGTLYVSFLFRCAAGHDSGDFLQFMLNDDTVYANSGSIGDLSTGDNKLGARIGQSNGGSTTASATAVTQGTTYLLVGRIQKSASSGGDTSGVNYDRMDLLINPASLTEPTTWHATRIGSSAISTLAYFGLRTAGLDAGDRYQFDEVRIGDTFASVLPEPATLALVGLGLAFAARARRR